jgi:predicted metalloprotease
MARVRDGGITVIAVCAHEFGHIHQMQNGYQSRLAALDSTRRPVELHADFLAGYYLALRKAEHRELDLSAVGGVLHALGDSDFNSRQHHGTPQERVGALAAGFKFGMEGHHDVAQAAQAGFELIRRNS